MMLPTIKDATDCLQNLNLQRRYLGCQLLTAMKLAYLREVKFSFTQPFRPWNFYLPTESYHFLFGPNPGYK